jgi:hypothetical protein
MTLWCLTTSSAAGTTRAKRGGTGSLGAAERSDAICTQDDSSTGPLQRLLGGNHVVLQLFRNDRKTLSQFNAEPGQQIFPW